MTFASFSLSVQASDGVDLAQMPASGMGRLVEFSAIPEGKRGAIANIPIHLPPYIKASFFSQDTAGVSEDEAGPWPSGTNRVLPWASQDDLGVLFGECKHTANPATKPPSTHGMMAIFQLASGEYLTLLPFGLTYAPPPLILTSWSHSS